MRAMVSQPQARPKLLGRPRGSKPDQRVRDNDIERCILLLNHLCDHGDTHHLNQGLFHSCLLPEVTGAVAALQGLFAGRPLQLIGFSLGGNFMLRVAAQARSAALNLGQVIAVSPVLDPPATLAALQRGMPGYELYFVRKWLRTSSAVMVLRSRWRASAAKS